ncbi:ATP-dependent helicase [Vibrio alginolyticus]|nr:3'-5' exonuclease [Vibrio sp. Y20_XG_PY13]MBM4846661.1 ATP-dependent helicase [Vibrio parahaemolyticus]
MYKVVQTKALNKCFRDLKKCGKKGKDAITKTRAAQSEAATEGEIQSLKRTNHGESRLTNAEKYDLGNGYRLVVQLVDGVSKTRAFIFAGSHDDTENWLESHKDYRWVKSDKDDTLDFVQVTEQKLTPAKIVQMDLESSEGVRELPLLRHVSEDEWVELGLVNSLKDYCRSVTAELWECDPNGVLEYIENSSNLDIAILMDDLFSHSHRFELKELHKRIELYLGAAAITHGKEFDTAVSCSSNSEIFVTWDEVAELPDDSSWSDWLLFLHPEQRELSIKDFNGPTRLRGVSGSGKTCVMLHRARYLAKKYKKPILLVTLTESMRKLLDALIGELCGVEATLIETYTIQSLAHKIIRELHPKGEAAYRKNNNTDIINEINKEAVEFVRKHKSYSSTGLSKLPHHEQKRFIEEEIYFIRSRLLNSDFENYLDSKAFKRHGRKVALRNEARAAFYDAARLKVDKLKELFYIDYEGAVAAACSLLLSNQKSFDSFGWAPVDEKLLSANIKEFSPYRCVLVDEVQDLSQLEVKMVAALRTGEEAISTLENGLFLVGDGAQTIYNKGFVLKQCGVNVSNRSYVLKKNYRNSKEIMEASYALIEKYEFADVDEDNIVKPTKPDLPTAVGEKPFVVKCKTQRDEVRFVCETIQELLESFSYDDEEQKSHPEICVIGLNKRIRELVSQELNVRSIDSCELKQTDSLEGTKSVKISTIESAKGHEFQHVFILGVMEGVMPNKSVENDNISREASRLYVAMTRARETLYITYNIANRAVPSRFLMDIQDYVNEYDCKEKLLEAI